MTSMADSATSPSSPSLGILVGDDAGRRWCRHSIAAALRQGRDASAPPVALDGLGVQHGLALAEALAIAPSLRGAAGTPAIADVARARMLLADLARCVRVLESVGIPHVVLKGGALLASGRTACGTRHTDDVDLLVPSARAREAFNALVAQPGFRGIAGRHVDGTDTLDALTHQLPIIIAPGGTPIELHVRTHVSETGGERTDSVFSDAAFVAVDGVQVATPSPPRLWRQLCAHVFEHHDGAPTLVARHLFDTLSMADVVWPAGKGDGAVSVWSERVSRGLVEALMMGKARGAVVARLVVPSPLLLDATALEGSARRMWRYALTDELGPGGAWRALFPSAAHLKATGDLSDAPSDEDEGPVPPIARAWWRRWRRLLRSR